MVTFRRIVHTDYDKLRPLVHEIAVNYNRRDVLKGVCLDFSEYKDIEAIVSEYTKNIIKNCSEGQIGFVCEKDNVLVGYIVGEIITDARKKYSKAGHVQDWFVTEGSRFGGIGKSLWGHLETEFVAQGVDFITLEVFYQNSKSRDIYRKMGFEEYEMTLLKRV